jgi:hypothetical protein
VVVPSRPARLPFFLGAIAAIAACSSNQNDTPSRPVCPDPYDPGRGFDFNVPVSLKNDVLPVFIASCAFGGCHGNPDPAKSNGIYIGDDLPAFLAGAVGVDSGELPTMKFIAKGDPKQSFFMRKIDGDLCTLNPLCLGKDCGREMPQGQEPIPQDKRDAIRRWIAQGANNN